MLVRNTRFVTMTVRILFVNPCRAPVVTSAGGCGRARVATPCRSPRAAARRRGRTVGLQLNRIDLVELERLEDRVERRRDLCSTPHDGAANRAFGRVVVERDSGIVDEAREVHPRCSACTPPPCRSRDACPRHARRATRAVRRGSPALGAAQVCDAIELALAAAIELVERADPRERSLGIGMIGDARRNMFTSTECEPRANNMKFYVFA